MPITQPISFKNLSNLRTVFYTFILLSSVLLAGCGNSWKLKTKGPQANEEAPKFAVKVYIENSGSMNGYMCDGAELKDAVYSYLSALNSYASSMQLNYINAEVVPMNVPLTDFIQRLSPSAFAQSGGSHAHSDFKQILSNVINNVNENTVAVFVSDCILDIPSGAASGFLNITRTDISNVVTAKSRKMPSLSFCIYQMESMFDGTYYFPKGGHVKHKGKRPYYLWVVGSQKNLAYILRNVPNTKIQHGVKNYCSFAPSVQIPNTLYSAGREVQELPLKAKRDGHFTCELMADLSMTLQSETYIASVGNYIDKSGCIKVVKAESLPTTSAYSHILSLEVAGQSFSDFLTVKKPAFPAWIELSNGMSDHTLEPSKTFSIKYIIGGVADAYDRYKEAGNITLTNSNH